MTKAEFNERRSFVAENSFEEAHRKGYLPEAAAVDKKIKADSEYSYYVVSYSREDSQYVLPEIYDLQEKGFEIWYDHGIVDRVTQDNDWRKIVHDRISDFHCRGVLFYISENFVLSPSIEEEVRIVRAAKKPHLEIALPMTEVGHKRAFYQAGKIAEIERELKSEKVLVERGLTDSRVKLYKRVFGDTVNYIRHTAPIEERITGLNGMKEPELFEFKLEMSYHIGLNSEVIAKHPGLFCKEIVSLVAVNHIDITEADIPEVVTINGTERKVTKIGDCAFANCRKLKSVNIPKTVTEIGDYAFYGCAALDTVELPTELWRLGIGAFKECTKLKNITIPQWLHSLSNYVFYNCKALKSVQDSSNLRRIGINAFRNCESLKEFVFSRDVNIENNAFTNSGLCDVKFLNGASCIGEQAFMDCRIKQINVPGDTGEIGERAFARCKDLESVTFEYCPKAFNNKLTREIFFGCKKLSRITVGFQGINISEYGIQCGNLLGIRDRDVVLEISDGIEIIGSFPDDPKWAQLNKGIHIGDISHITLPDSLTSIGQMGMSSCYDLTEIVIPDNVKLIGERAFAECYSLNRIIFGSSVEEIKKGAFTDCECKDVAFEGNIESCTYYTEDDPNTEHELDVNDKFAVIDVLKKGCEIRIIRG